MVENENKRLKPVLKFEKEEYVMVTSDNGMLVLGDIEIPCTNMKIAIDHFRARWKVEFKDE